MDAEYWQRVTKARRSRRGVVRAGAGAAALALVGCGDDDDAGDSATPASSSPTTEPVTQGGTLRFPLLGIGTAPLNTLASPLFPFSPKSGFVGNTMAAFHYSRLLRGVGGPSIAPGDLTRVEGDLASGWEIADPTTYIFTLKPNIKWHDKPPMNGRAATAEDFVSAYKAFAEVAPPIANWNSFVDSVVAPDARTIRVSLKAPFAPFLTRASSDRDMWLIPVETIASEQAGTDPVGTGPYVFRGFDTEAVKWAKNPAYFDAPLPNFDAVEAGTNGDATKIVASLQGGGYDWSKLNGATFAASRAALDPAGRDVFVPNAIPTVLYFNYDNKPFDDARVRRAISMAVDRDGGLGLQDPTRKGNWQSFVPPFTAPYYTSPRDDNSAFGAGAANWKRNLKDARDLLRAATGAETLKFKLIASVDLYGATFAQAVEIVADTIREAGFEAELVYEPNLTKYVVTTYRGQMAPGSMAMGLLPQVRDPDPLFVTSYWSQGAHNWGGAAIPEQAALDAMFEKQRTILNTDERVSYIKEIQYAMSESMPMVPLWAVSDYVYAQPWLKNFHYKATFAFMADGLMKAYFTPERVKKG